jgi:hypothetical protein
MRLGQSVDRVWYSDCDTGMELEELWFDSRKKQHIFSTTKLAAVYTPSLLLNRQPSPFPRDREQGHETGQLLPSSAKVKSKWSSTHTSVFAFVA